MTLSLKLTHYFAQNISKHPILQGSRMLVLILKCQTNDSINVIARFHIPKKGDKHEVAKGSLSIHPSTHPHEHLGALGDSQGCYSEEGRVQIFSSHRAHVDVGAADRELGWCPVSQTLHHHLLSHPAEWCSLSKV